MKIRTDFVTNSSSSNFVTINIKNPKLAELVRAAKRTPQDWELEKRSVWTGIDIDESEQTVNIKTSINYYEPDDKLDPALFPEHLDDLPGSLSKVLENLSEHWFPDYDLAVLRNTLKENSRVIITDTESADWTYEAEGYGEAALYQWYWDLVNSIVKKEHLDYKPGGVWIRSTFHYDKANGESVGGEFSYDEPESALPYDDISEIAFPDNVFLYEDLSDEEYSDEDLILEDPEEDLKEE